MSTNTTIGARPRGRPAGRAPSAPANGRPPGRVDDGTVKDLCEMFKMLSDPSRLKILLALAQNGEMHVSALRELLGQSQPAVSHHLSLMRHVKLVDCKRDGKHNFYRLDSGRVGDLLEQLFADIGNAARQLHFEEFALTFRRK